MAYSVHDFTPVLDTSAYASGDVLFVAKELPNFFDRTNPRMLQSVVVLDGDDQAQAFDLVFSDAAITLGTINAAVSISDADAAKIIAYVKLATSDANDTINSNVFAKTGIGAVMKSSGLTNSVWVSGICRSGTPTYTASGMKMKFGIV